MTRSELQELIREELSSLYTESPEAVELYKERLRWVDGTTYPFGEFKGVMYVGKEGSTHGQMGRDVIPREEWMLHKPERRDMNNCGRIWVDRKIISFWTMNDPIERVIMKINVAFKHTDKNIHIDKSWYLDSVSEHNRSELLNISSLNKMHKSEYTVNWKGLVK